MGSCNSVNRGQVNEVLAQVEATSTAIRGIEANAEQIHKCSTAMKAQREELTMAAEHAVRILDKLNERFNSKSDEVCDLFDGTFRTLATLVEEIETSMYELGLQDVLHDLTREFGPLLVPAVVLLIIITVSNCIFGFLLAGDPRLAGAFSIGGFVEEAVVDSGGQEDAAVGTQASSGKGLSILGLFATFHVVLIGMSILYLIIEGVRQTCCRRQSGRQQDRLFDTEFGSVYTFMPSRTQWQTHDSRRAFLRQWGRMALQREAAPADDLDAEPEECPEVPRAPGESSESLDSI